MALKGLNSKICLLAYVIEREEMMLALEFRIDNRNVDGILDQGQKEVLKSFTILGRM